MNFLLNWRGLLTRGRVERLNDQGPAANHSSAG